MTSYGRVCDKIIQKYPLPRVLLHGQRDPDDQAKTKAAANVIYKTIRGALRNHKVFLNTFQNIMKKVFYGAPIDQMGLAHFNIQYSSANGNNVASISQQPNDRANKAVTKWFQ